MSNNGPKSDHHENPIPVSTEFPSKTAHESKDGSEQGSPLAAQSPRSSQDSHGTDDTERDHAPPVPSRGVSPGNETIDLREELEPFDWEELEARFHAKMEECTREEEKIGEEFREWVEARA